MFEENQEGFFLTGAGMRCGRVKELRVQRKAVISLCKIQQNMIKN
jgi:hypothetical protein